MSKVDPEIVAAFRTQAAICERMASPLYAALLVRAADDVEAGGPLAAVVRDFTGHPVLDNVPLRTLGAAHHLALCGEAPELARYLPSCGGSFEAEGAFRALLALAEARAEALRAALGEQVQTNEVQRCAALLGGLLTVAHETQRPLALLEIGASAGLNQLFDRYRYEPVCFGPAWSWGPADARLVLRAEWRGTAPPTQASLRVGSRRACDPFPFDLRDGSKRLRLESFFWPDQLERLARLRAALATAAEDPPRVERARAGTWLPQALARPRPGYTTVVFHSVMWWYVPQEERQEVSASVRRAGERATGSEPLAWLRLEGASQDHCELRLLLWPGGEDRLLARAHYHGSWVEWLHGSEAIGEA